MQPEFPNNKKVISQMVCNKSLLDPMSFLINCIDDTLCLRALGFMQLYQWQYFYLISHSYTPLQECECMLSLWMEELVVQSIQITASAASGGCADRTLYE